jgi:MFS transporter, ACS family, 4-hydroxyphenylacetate permease
VAVNAVLLRWKRRYKAKLGGEMSNIALQRTMESAAEHASVLRKVSRRIIPFFFILYIFNFLDRINIGFAALSMNHDLGLTSTNFGIANTLFYVGYVACEIPSNILMARFGARVWLSRIMITWGMASAATMFVVDANSLFGLRFLLGILEAGFVPGVLLYLTYWFPDNYRARANGMLMVSQPVAMAIGSTMSGIILDQTHGLLGLQGWRWMFLIEGLPAAALGVFALYYLTNRPSEARWLDTSERQGLETLMQEDRDRRLNTTHQSIWSQVLDIKVILLAMAYFCLVNTVATVSTWGPMIVREAMSAYSLTQVGMVAAVAPICTIIIMPLWVWSSDRRRERIWHLSAALLLATCGWLLVIFIPQGGGRLFGFCCATVGVFSAMAVFWTLPQGLLSESARPAGIGFISAVGLMSSIISSTVFGFLRDTTGSFNAGLFYVAGLLVVSMVLAWIVVGFAQRVDQPLRKW